jgi:hypothetical protein
MPIPALRSADKSGKMIEDLIRRHEMEGNYLVRSSGWFGNGQRRRFALAITLSEREHQRNGRACSSSA